MVQISLSTKKIVLSFYLNTAAKRLVLENRIKAESESNKCYSCIKAFLESTNKS